MPSIVSFIGWHNSGKTTLAAQVVTQLKKLNYRVAVIKSSKTSGIKSDTPGTDTSKYQEAGTDSVLLVAPDKMVLQTENQNLSLTTLANRYFPNYDIVIAEGFKQAEKVAKIEVIRDPNQLLREKVTGVIAIASDHQLSGDHVFQLNDSLKIADFITEKFLLNAHNKSTATLFVNGREIPLTVASLHSPANTVIDFVQSLDLAAKATEIELKIRIKSE